MVLSFFANFHPGENVTNLQSITVRLFGHYAPDPVGTFLGDHRIVGSGNSSGEDNAVVTDLSFKKNTSRGWELRQCVGLLKM